MTAFEYLEQSGFGITDAQQKNMAAGTSMISVLSRLRSMVRENDALTHDEFTTQATNEHTQLVQETGGNTLELIAFLEVCDDIWSDARK